MDGSSDGRESGRCRRDRRGDAAGQRAALRLIDLALPLLEAGRSLRFAMMPEGQDPDDLLKSSGPAAVQKLLDDEEDLLQLLAADTGVALT
mgnify:CR=1 FL=1